jgi:hypothetical protein
MTQLFAFSLMSLFCEGYKFGLGDYSVCVCVRARTQKQITASLVVSTFLALNNALRKLKAIMKFTVQMQISSHMLTL